MSKVLKEHTHVFAHNFLNIQWIFNLQNQSMSKHVGGIKGYFDLWHLQQDSTYIAFDGMVEKLYVSAFQNVF